MRNQLIFCFLITRIALISIAEETNPNVITFESLFETALDNSAALSEKASMERAASYKVIEAKTKGAPVLSFESTLNYIHSPDTITVGAGSFGEVPVKMPLEDTVFSLSGNSFYDFKLILDQPVFTWGKIYNNFQAEKEGAAAAAVDSLKLRDLIKTELYIQNSSISFLKKIKTAINKQKEIALRLEQLAMDSFENGMILYTDYLDIRMKRKESELMEYRIEEQLNQVLLNLIYLTGKELTEEMIPDINPDDRVYKPWQDLYDDALLNNRDLLLLRHGVNADEYKMRIQKGTYYLKPDLAFHLELSYSGSNFPFFQEGWLSNDKGNFTLSVGIKAPIADFGSIHAAVKNTEEILNASQAAYVNNLEQLEKYIRQIFYELELNLQIIGYYNERIETDIGIMDQKEKEWLSGYGDEADFLNKQINYYSNIILLHQEQIKESTNYYKLLNITGKIEDGE